FRRLQTHRRSPHDGGSVRPPTIGELYAFSTVNGGWLLPEGLGAGCCTWPNTRATRDQPRHEALGRSSMAIDRFSRPALVIVDKFGYGAFHNTNLDDLLKARHVESVLITGTVTQICVEETARESFRRGYPTTLVSDAVSTYAPDLQTAVLKNFAHKFGWVSTAKEVIAALESLAIR